MSLRNPSNSNNPSQVGEWINRAKPITFRFEGETFNAYEGDTISSALWAANQKILGRSFKYHRPRGILSLANHDVNILLTDGIDTNIRADVVEVKNGMHLHAVNTKGGVKKDKNSIIDALSPLLPVGFYYKAFHKPRWLFPFWENVIRKAAGLGVVNVNFPRITKQKLHTHCDVLIIGAGAAGLSAACVAAQAGLQVMLVDENKRAGGSLTYDHAGKNESIEYLGHLLQKVNNLANIKLVTNAYAAGYYANHLIPIVSPAGITKVRAKAVIVATGTFEQPPVFKNNDLPGVMLGSAAQRLVYRYGVKPCQQGIVFTANNYGYRVALDMLKAGTKVEAVVDLRSQSAETQYAIELKSRGVNIYTGYCVYEAIASSDALQVQAAVICPYDEKNNIALFDKSFTVQCDGIAMCAGAAPAAALLYQAGVGMQYDNATQQFVPHRLPEGIFAAGKVNGVFKLDQRMKDGERAANDVLHFLDKPAERIAVKKHIGSSPSHPYPIVPHPKGKNFIDFDEDIQLKDFEHAAMEGFDNIELMKRFTTVGMGPSQGKHSNMNAIRILAKIRNLPVEKIGTTTSRPFFHPTPMGHLAGRGFHPHRHTALHDWHAANGAVFTDIGAWKRAAYYLQAGQEKDKTKEQAKEREKVQAITAELLAVRTAVGMIDGSSLGKIEVHGPDAAEFLERFFTGKYVGQKLGTWRYILMLDEAGVVVDDGVACRLAQDLFYLSVGTANAAMVYREMQRWQQIWQLNIALVNVTGAFGAINLAGPDAQNTLAKLTDCDLSLATFPLGHVRETLVANIPSKIIRASFVSDMAYEIHCPMNQLPTIWSALLTAGEQYAIRPFGSDTQRLLRLEMGHAMPGVDTDGLTNPFEMGADWAVKMDKPYFVGQRSLAIISKRPLSKQLVAFTLDANYKGEMPLDCNLVIDGDNIDGRVTSIAFSPTLGKTIGLAYVKPRQNVLGAQFQIRTDNGSLVSATVVKTPFIHHGQDV